MLQIGVSYAQTKDRLEVAMYQSIWWSRQTKNPEKGNHRRKSEQGIVKAWVQWKYFWNSFVRRGAIDTTQITCKSWK